MNTLITPVEALRLAFREGETLPPGIIAEADIAAAEHRYLVPVLGQELYDELLGGAYGEFREAYLAAPAALCVRLLLQPRLDILTGACGTTAPRSSWSEPADGEALRRLCRALRTEIRTLLRRATDYLDVHRAEFPEYNPQKNILKRCSTDGGFVQTL